MSTMGGMSELKGYACLTCRNRKVKCDQNDPCSNCIKDKQTCTYVKPVRGKRKRAKPAEGLHAKVRRYEDLLRSRGIDINDASDGVDSGSETASMTAGQTHSDTLITGRRGDLPAKSEVSSRNPDYQKIGDEDDSSNALDLLTSKPRLIQKGGDSRYYETAPWSRFYEARHPEGDDIPGEPENDLKECGLCLDPEHSKLDLHHLYLPSPVLFKLKDIYLDRADPLFKVLHFPSVWPAMMEVAQANPDHRDGKIFKPLQALLFCFYLITLCAMNEEECQRILGLEKSILLIKYELAAREALANAGLLSTSSTMTLSAFVLFIMSVRKIYRSATIFVLSGICVRLAQKMGLHRDGTAMKLSPFETEIRRRLWWHIVHVDFRVADVIGARPSGDLTSGDVKHPLNLEDEDFYPGITEFPLERKGITAITLCLFRCEIMQTLHQFPTNGGLRWEGLASTNISVAEKDRLIELLEDRLERRFLRYCDPIQPLSTLMAIMFRSAVCKMKIFAHNPRQLAKKDIPESEREVVFKSAVKLLEYVPLLKGNSFGLEKYMWQMGSSYLWNAILYVLLEMRHRKTGPEIERTWQLIGTVLHQYPEMFQERTETVYVALGRWTLDVWDEFVAASVAEGLTEPVPLDFIQELRRVHRPAEPDVFDRGVSGEGESVMLNPQSDPVNYPEWPSFGMDESDWMWWEQLLGAQGGFNPI